MKSLHRNTAHPGTETGANTGGSKRPEALCMSAPCSKMTTKTWQFKTDASKLQRWCFVMQCWICSQEFQTLPRTFIKLAWAELQVSLPRFFMQLQEQLISSLTITVQEQDMRINLHTAFGEENYIVQLKSKMPRELQHIESLFRRSCEAERIWW